MYNPYFPFPKPVPSNIYNINHYHDRIPVKHYRPQTEPVTPNNLFKIVIILDESGSMESVRNNMIKSINDLIKEQKQIKERPASFTLVKFNHLVNRVIKNISLEEISLLNSEDYTPSGGTALYDCIGDTIEWFRNEKDVLMIIVTDGQENSSKSFTKDEITRMIDEKKNKNGWTYVYLSNDLSTASQGDFLGFKKSDHATNNVIRQEEFATYLSNNVCEAISNCRKSGLSVQRQLNHHIW